MALLALFFACDARRGIGASPNPLSLPLALFLGWATLSLLWAHNRYESSVTLLNWGAAAIAFFLISNGLRTATAVRRLLVGIFISGTVLALLGMIQFWAGETTFTPSGSSGTWLPDWLRWIGTWVGQHIPPAMTFSNKNMASQYSLLTLPVGVGLFLQSECRRLVWCYALGTSLMAVFLVYAQTRAAYIAALLQVLAFVGFILWAIKQKSRIRSRGRAKIWAAGAAGLLFLLLSHVSATGLVSRAAMVLKEFRSIADVAVSYDERRHYRNDSRLVTWRNSLELIKDHPFLGVGVGNWLVDFSGNPQVVQQHREFARDGHAGAFLGVFAPQPT